MRPAHLFLRGMSIIACTLFFSDTYSQEISFLQAELFIAEESIQGNNELEPGMLIVDSRAARQSYPSMEQEMEMYLKLKGDEPLVYFFPNPSKGTIWMEHNLGPGLEVNIQDADGNKIFRTFNHMAQKLDLSVLNPGDYTLTVRAAGYEETRSLQVRK